jgi:hypothetical protein
MVCATFSILQNHYGVVYQQRGRFTTDELNWIQFSGGWYAFCISCS